MPEEPIRAPLPSGESHKFDMYDGYSGVKKTGRDSYFAVVWLRDAEGNIDGSATFDFREVERLRRSEFNVYMEAKLQCGTSAKEWTGRINLASASAREGVVRAFSRMFKGKEFDSCLSMAISALGKTLDKEPRSKALWQIGEPPEDGGMLLGPFVKAGAPNLIFGSGGSCKTYLVLMMLYSLATGLPFLGFKPTRKVKCLFVDYEDSETNFRRRLDSVMAGFGGAGVDDAVANIRHFKPGGAPLCDIVASLKKEIDEYGIEVMAIDSVAYACGAEVEKSETAIRYYNALDDIGIASIGIGHVTKSSSDEETKDRGQQHAIGSIFHHNAPRNIWNAVLQEGTDEADPVKNVALFHRKFNDGPRHPMVPVEVSFQGKPPALSVSARIGSGIAFDAARPLPDRILSFLRRGPTSRKALDEEFSEERPNTMKSILRRLKSSGKIRQLGGDNGDYSLI